MSLSSNQAPLNHMCDLLDHQTPFVPYAITSDEGLQSRGVRRRKGASASFSFDGIHIRWRAIFNFVVVKNRFLITLFKDMLLPPPVSARSRVRADCRPGHLPMHFLSSRRRKEGSCGAPVPPSRIYQAPAPPSSSSQRSQLYDHLRTRNHLNPRLKHLLLRRSNRPLAERITP